MQGSLGLNLSPSPHLRSPITTSVIMRDVIVGLLPAAAVGVYLFGTKAALVLLVAAVSAVLAEAVIQKAMGRPVTVFDGSAAVAGLLFGMILPPGVNILMVAAGSVILIGLGKQVFGGLGHNPFNPAHVGRAVLLASWPVAMTAFEWPRAGLLSEKAIEAVQAAGAVDVVSGPTPLALMRYHGVQVPYLDLFMGNVAGSIGETSALALIVGALFLLVRGHISWHIPLSYFGSVALIMVAFGQDPLFHMLAGGLVIGAFFMATDYVTTPLTGLGQVIFGLGCGVITAFIRLYGGYPEGVCYAILLMNATTPLIDKVIQPARFGGVTKVA